nr:signal recognition particle protein [Rhizobiaceae bacterium]
ADMMKAMGGKGKGGGMMRGLMGGMAQKMGLGGLMGGMGGMPDLSKMSPAELAELQKQAEQMGLGKGDGLPPMPPVGGGMPKLPGLGGPKLPGLGGPGLPGLPKGPKK